MFPFQRSYYHLNRIEVSKDALVHNYRELQRINTKCGVIPVLKSNAYGHGLAQLAQVVDTFKAPLVAVDSLYEAYELQKFHVKTPILILGYTQPDNFKVKRLPFQYAVYDARLLKTLDRYQPGVKIHLFVDTGMSREGIPLSQLRAFITEAKKCQHISIVGLCSHFADADTHESEMTQKQLHAFEDARKIVKDEGITISYTHISASGGALHVDNSPFSHIRVGLVLYGFSPLSSSDPDNAKVDVHPALSLHSTLVQVKTIAKGSSIGYGCTFTAKKEMTIGILPLGYYEGVDRRLSNVGCVTIRGTMCPIVGRVSMNMTTIDVSNATTAAVGDDVVVYSDNPSDPNSIQTLAGHIGSIPYELLAAGLSESVYRKLV
ncbi:alanine racemase [Candidatus Cerribacteria bacterium 'Amazon FNV 2010 28 9']|uniref:Alanine racemase n=1 Tax=Candidatus Cerribacteria bacterium 'Amazon FNV 2010 28 9' TaxID=2081795 RepID=A0A317JNJ5_9BACT|nr:MAG: alanine racemase [Candidatus Cerribacteria bacterium 'Amazon FNV 2010 28 9']